MLFRVGSCRRTGSLTSGGIHIRHRDPCCWKWTSSMAQRSTLSSRTSARSFFVRQLKVGIRVGQLGSRLAQAETEATEQALALPCSDGHAELLLQEGRQRFPIPERCREAILGGASSQRRLDPLQ